MPLYTYIVTYNNSTYVGQGRHSNFRGFVSAWISEMPETALEGFTSNLKKQLSQKAFSSNFEQVPNRLNVWQKTLEIDGKLFCVHAIETKG